jgi:DNA-binding transcriptional ArsR family regulator
VSTARTDDNGRPKVTLDLALLRDRPPRVAVTPGPSLCALAADIAGANRGSPREWVTAARAQLEPGDLAVLRPMGAPSGSFTPGRVAIIGTDDTDGIEDDLERIATLPIEYLLDDIAFAYGPSPPPPWDVVARNPRRWLVRYARALGRIWRGMREPWAAAAGLMEREVERVETAANNGALPELMGTLHHRARVRNGVWELADADSLSLHLSERGLVVTPLLGGPGTARATYNEELILRAIVYPLPGAHRLLEGDLLPPAQALESLLGAQRAHILRLLDRPRSPGELANAMLTVPSAATHHLRALEAAGLVVRERAGKNVMVHRTSRGAALLALY